MTHTEVALVLPEPRRPASRGHWPRAALRTVAAVRAVSTGSPVAPVAARKQYISIVMDFGIAIETDSDGFRRMSLVQGVCDSLCDRFRDETFGSGVERVTIGFIYERIVPGFESFAREERETKFEAKQVVELIDGGSEVLTNTFGYDVKLTPAQYKQFITASEAEAMTLLTDILIGSLVKLDALPAEIENFDSEGFKSAVTAHLRELGANR
jgi:hypothetical protein